MPAPLLPKRAPEDAAGSAGSIARDAGAACADPATRPFTDAAVDPVAETRIGQLLRQAGNMTAENIERVARTQQELGLRFGDAAMRLGLVNQDDIDAAIARQFAYPLAPRGASTLSPRLVAAFHPASQQGDTLRAIRSQLLLRWFGTGQYALAISGVAQGDASSVLAANLALVFAQLGHRTLLVDANLRHSVQHALFGMPARPGWPGLSDVLAGRAGLGAISAVPGFGTLALLGSGTVPPNPQELLERASFGLLHAQLGKLYDVVLYDIAPTSHGAEALAIAAHAGATLLVAQKDHTPVAALKRMAQQMAAANVAVIGSVLVEA
jgi:protein-tyrosine kinase